MTSATSAATSLVENTAEAATVYGGASVLKAAIPYLIPISGRVLDFVVRPSGLPEVAPQALTDFSFWEQTHTVLTPTAATSLVGLVHWFRNHNVNPVQ